MKSLIYNKSMNESQLNILFDEDNDSFESLVVESFPTNESDDVEYKLADGGFPNEFWSTYSAFANTSGGVIILGVKETKNGLQFNGIEESKIPVLLKSFWDLVNNTQKVSTCVCSSSDVLTLSYQNKKFLAFRVPAATRTQKPVYLKGNPIDNTYKRNYEGDYVCTREEVHRMLADADLNLHADNRILEGFTMDDFDISSINQYKNLFRVTRPDHVWLSLSDEEFLKKIGAIRKDRKTQVEAPTVAGMLMFGKFESITDPECCPHFFPEFREVMSSDPSVRWTDRIYPDGTWEPNLFQFYRRIFPKLSSTLPKPFQLTPSGQRVDDTSAHEALREAFVNALVHSDYLASSNIVIEQKQDAFIFTNPGTLLVSLDQYYEGGYSECRNKTLQQMFVYIGTAERAGSGVNKIMKGWGASHWRPPYLMTKSRPDRVVLELTMASILPQESLDNLVKIFGEDVLSLGTEARTILVTCEIEGTISNYRLQYMLDMHRTDITKILKDLCKNGYLTSENKNRWTTYHLNKKRNEGADEESSYSETSENQLESSNSTSINSKTDTSNVNTSNVDTSNVDTSSENTTNVDTSSENTTNVDTSNVDTSVHKGTNVDTSVHKSTNVDTSGDNSSNSEHSNVDSSDRESLLELIETSDSDSFEDVEEELGVDKRLNYEELSELVRKFCQDYKSIEEIADALGKSSKYMKNNIIRRMTDEGKLIRQFEQKNHPNQKYKIS